MVNGVTNKVADVICDVGVDGVGCLGVGVGVVSCVSVISDVEGVSIY